MAAMQTRYPAGISRNTVLLAFASLFADISSEMLYPILPIFLTQVLHASGSIVGAVEGIAEATQNVVQGFSGWLSDKLQKRKALALIGYFVSALGKPLMGIATAWPGVLGGRFLDRFGAGFRSAPRDALIASSVSDEYRGRAFGLEGIGDNLGAFLGPLLAVLLFLSFHFEIRWIFLLAVVPGLLAFSMVLLVHERPVPVAAKSKIDVSLREFPVGYWKYLLVIGVFEIGNSSNSFLILQTRSIGASFAATIVIYASFNLVAALISYPAGSLSDRWGRRNILLASFVIFFVAYLGFARTRSVVAIAALFVFYGLFQGIFRSVGKAFASDFVPELLRASAVGWYSAVVGLLQLVASVVAGLLWDHISHAAVFYYGAIFAIAGSVGLLFIPGKRTRSAVYAQNPGCDFVVKDSMVPRVVIVGGGFGGLSAVRALRNAPVRVTLIDKRNYHLFRPMLYQVATGLLSADEISGPLRSIFRRQKNVDVLLDEVTGINADQRIVHLTRGDLAYEFLILATGIQYNYFGHDEWRQFAPGLESLDDADVIRSKILRAFERAEEMASIEHAGTEEIRRQLTFALVGAGTVGVEMAGTLAEMSRMALAHDFRHIDPASARILLYEAGARILPTYPEGLSIKAQEHLENLGVEVHTNALVTRVDSEGIIVGGERIQAGTVLWGAGVVASPAGRWLKVETDRSGKIIVRPDLSVPGHPEVFAIGDTAHVVAPVRNLLGIKSKTPMVMPGVAQPAIQEGKYVADVIQRRVAAHGEPQPFWYWDKGDLAIVGRTYAVADLRFAKFAGFPAWVIWAIVHIYFLIGFANRLFVLLQWGLAFLTKRRRVRVLPVEPPSAQRFIDPAA